MKNFVDIDSSDDEADLARWKKTLDEKLPNVKSEEPITDDEQLSPRYKTNTKGVKEEYECMNIKPSRQKRQPRCRDSSLHDKESASMKQSNTKPSKKNKYSKGMKVAKMTWIPFEGKISHVPKNESEWYHVIYDDGDEEDMDHSELEHHVNAYCKKYPKESRPISKKGRENLALNTKMIRQFPEFTTGKVVSSKIDEN